MTPNEIHKKIVEQLTTLWDNESDPTYKPYKIQANAYPDTKQLYGAKNNSYVVVWKGSDSPSVYFGGKSIYHRITFSIDVVTLPKNTDDYEKRLEQQDYIVDKTMGYMTELVQGISGLIQLIYEGQKVLTDIEPLKGNWYFRTQLLYRADFTSMGS